MLVVGASIYIYIYIYIFFFFFGTIILFLFFFYNVFAQTSTNVFLNYTNAALIRFATMLKVHTIARANMDSREMDVNVKVGGSSLSNYVIKNKAYICKSSKKGW